MERRPIAYQLYSARDEAAKDLQGTLEALHDMGYNGIEFAGLYGHEPKEVRAMLDALGLKAVSAHVPVSEIEADPEKVIADYKLLGCEYLAVPYLDEQCRPGAAGFAAKIATIYRFAQLCQKNGIQLLYHNHDFEFVALSSQYGLDFLYDAIPADLLQCELDTCWVKYAGVEPCAYLAKYAGRCPVVHLKDFVGVKGGATPYALIGQEGDAPADDIPFSYKPWGYGCQDVEKVRQAAIDAGAKWLIIEQDESKERPALVAAQMSIETVKR